MTDFLLMVGGALFAMMVSGIVNYGKRAWVGLTDDEMTECIVSICNTDDGTGDTRDLIRVVEAKLKEKNT